MPQEVRAGLDTHWNEWGSGAPALLLHCGLASSRMWAPMAKALEGRFAMVAPDLPGHGRSGAIPPGADLHDRITDMAASFLRGGDTVLGHSLGGTVALRLALERRAPLKRLVLVEPVLFAAARGTPAWDAHQAETAHWNTALAAGDLAGAAKGFSETWGARPWDTLSSGERETLAARMQVISGTAPALSEDSTGMLAPGRLEAVEVPVILLRGEHTDAIMRQVHEVLRTRLPDVEERVVPGAGHMLPMTHPEAVIDAMG